MPARQNFQNKVNYQNGLAAEAIVAQTYLENGAAVQDTRWRATCGEIDLILRDGLALVFCEVKAAKTVDSGLARVTPAKQRRIMRTAQAYMAKKGYDQMTDIRFDVAVVPNGGAPYILENALAA
ncbi:MAG: YraN family protein [Planktomarina sp.]